jgi:hypothetical protein
MGAPDESTLDNIPENGITYAVGVPENLRFFS